ncbi:MAG: cellulase family glycosylhydrolase [Eubacteriales bacterium]|nr:cellulase family glycosylhydrolase [Eubacteriales bacterium]
MLNQNKKLHVSGTQLVDSNNQPVQLRGISTHGIGWYPAYVNQELFHEFRKDWGMNVIRLAMYTDEPEGYCTDGDQAALKELVCKGVESG